MNVEALLDRPIAFHRAFVTLTGSVTAALFLSQAVYWSRRTNDDDGWFYKTVADWEDETGLTFREQETAKRKLISLGIMDVEKRGGTNRTNYFRVNQDRIFELWNWRNPHHPTCGKRTMETAENAPCIHRLRSKTTTENPTDDSKARARPKSLEDVLGRCRETGVPESTGEAFWHFYESKGWKVGKSPMVNWRSALAGWKARAKPKGSVDPCHDPNLTAEERVQAQLRHLRGEA